MKKKFKELFNAKTMSILIITLVSIVVYMLLLNFYSVKIAVGKLLGYVSPLFTGFVIAYLLNPVVTLFREKCFKKMKNRSAANAISVVITIILVLAIISSLIAVVLPEVYLSGKTLLVNIDSYISTFKGLVGEFLADLNFIDIDLDKIFGSWENFIDVAIEWLNNNTGKILDASKKVGATVLDFVLSFLIGVYFLFDKKRLVAGVKRFSKAVMKPEKYIKWKATLNQINFILSKFISSELIDMCFIGFSNYIFMILFRMPYPLLISIIVALTNLIPNFGPFIGGIPSVLLILIIDPMSAILFAIWTIAIQFLDGNFIKPLLIGDALGMSPTWVLVSIVVGGKMFGIAGMVLAVPVVALATYFIEEKIKIIEANKAQAAGEAPTDTQDDSQNDTQQTTRHMSFTDKIVDTMKKHREKRNEKRAEDRRKKADDAEQQQGTEKNDEEDSDNNLTKDEPTDNKSNDKIKTEEKNCEIDPTADTSESDKQK